MYIFQKNVVDCILGMKWFTFDFSFMSTDQWLFLNKIQENVKSDQENLELQTIGLNSKSTVINSENLIFTILTIICIHLW